MPFGGDVRTQRIRPAGIPTGSFLRKCDSIILGGIQSTTPVAPEVKS